MWLPPYLPPSLNRKPSDPPEPDNSPSTIWLFSVIVGALALCLLAFVFLGSSR